MDFSKDEIGKRYRELHAARAPLVDARDRLWADLIAIVGGDSDLPVGEAKAAEEKVRARIKEIQAELAPIDNEYAGCARFLGARAAEYLA